MNNFERKLLKKRVKDLDMRNVYVEFVKNEPVLYVKLGVWRKVVNKIEIFDLVNELEKAMKKQRGGR